MSSEFGRNTRSTIPLDVIHTRENPHATTSTRSLNGDKAEVRRCARKWITWVNHLRRRASKRPLLPGTASLSSESLALRLMTPWSVVIDLPLLRSGQVLTHMRNRCRQHLFSNVCQVSPNELEFEGLIVEIPVRMFLSYHLVARKHRLFNHLPSILYN